MTAYGSGVTTDRRITSVKNDTTAQTNYGIIQGTITNQTISSQDMLDDWCQAELNRLKVPHTTYQVGMVDLSQSDTSDYSFDAGALEIGTIVNLIGGNSDVDIYTQIIRITRSLQDVLDVQIDVSNPDAGTVDWGQNESIEAKKPDLLDQIVSLFKKIKIQEHDTGIISDILAGIAGGTIAVPADPALADLTNVVWYDDVAAVGNLVDYLSTIFTNDPSIIGDIADTTINQRLSDETPEDIATTGDVGVSTDLAHVDHVHGGYDPPVPATTTPTAIASSGSIGADEGKYANEKHTHAGVVVGDLPVTDPGTPENIGVAGATGSETRWAKGDHVHKGALAVETVDALPAIPTTGMLEVFWTSVSTGDGDDQVWRAYVGQTAYTPTQFTSSLSGTP